MSMKRSETFYLNVAASTARQTFTLTPKKKADDLTLYSVYCGDPRAKVLLELYIDGNFIASWDGLRFATGNEPVHVDAVIPAGSTVTLYVTDQPGTGNAAFPFTIAYDIRAGA